ncbi:MAG TPA: hypothetical protein VL523_05900 [Terriglobia bacterium]|nr:hypothetical protein [Terriglobia bacterium]
MTADMRAGRGKRPQPGKVRATNCFVLMPFSNAFNDVFETITSALDGLGLHCWRADQVNEPGNVVVKILEDIKQADIIIADLTGRNPNVFYETGRAHELKDPAKVILLAQTDDDVPFDLRALRYLKYNPDKKGRKELRSRLRDYVIQAATASGGLYETIETSSERTRRIVADFDALLKDNPAFVESLIIRVQAGLSSIAISDLELVERSDRPKERIALLIKERNLLRALIGRGAAARVIISPPTGRYVVQSTKLSYLRDRYERLIAVLEEAVQSDPSDDPFRSDRCQIALAPFRGNNLLILGDRLLYEGVKVNLERGFDLTTRVTHAASVATRVRAFDRLFDDAKKYTLEYFGGTAPSEENPADTLRRAALLGIRDAYKQFQLASPIGTGMRVDPAAP